MDEQLDFRFKYLLYLLEIANSDTQSEAAENLEISQPALSLSIDSLEESWGVQLFEKQGRRLVLTAAGKALVDYGSQVYEKTQEVKEWLDSLSGGTTGKLRVGMTDSANLYILPDALLEFRNSFPEVEMNLFIGTSEPLWERLANFELDITFVIYNPSLDSQFLSIEIVSQDLYLYAPKSLNPKTSPWALYPSDSQTRALIDRGIRENGFVPDVAIEAGNPQILQQMVKLGFACSVLPETEVDEKIKKLKCQKIATRKLVALTRKTSPPDKRIQNLIKLARSSQSSQRVS